MPPLQRQLPLPPLLIRAVLITGGLGALGLQSAEWLVEQGAQHLVLVGRNQPSAVAQDTITQLENAGVQVYMVTADISDAAAANDMFEFIGSSLPPLRGVNFCRSMQQRCRSMQQRCRSM